MASTPDVSYWHHICQFLITNFVHILLAVRLCHAQLRLDTNSRFVQMYMVHGCTKQIQCCFKQCVTKKNVFLCLLQNITHRRSFKCSSLETTKKHHGLQHYLWSVHSKYPWCDIIDNPVHATEQIFTSDCTAVLNQPMVCFNWVKIQSLRNTIIGASFFKISRNWKEEILRCIINKS